jgi:hypothetical protein
MIAGLTGHQKIGDSLTIQWVERQLSSILVEREIREGCMSLAIGADQMYATLLFEKHVPYTVIVPCQRYEDTFLDEERERYFYLLSKAASVVALQFVEPSEIAFYEAGKEVVRRSDILIAVWDGQGAKGLGGTADVVHFAQAQSQRVLHVDTVAHVVRET